MTDKITAGDVKKARVQIEISGDTLELVPSPGAILSLSAKYDGFGPLLASLQRLNVQAAADVAIAGLGVEGKRVANLTNQVVEEGVVNLMPKLVEFVMILANGGRPLKEEAADDGDENPPRT